MTALMTPDLMIRMLKNLRNLRNLRALTLYQCYQLQKYFPPSLIL